jgi:hypothetical protein
LPAGRADDRPADLRHLGRCRCCRQGRQRLRKGNDKLVIKAGSFDGKVLDKAGVQALASIPSREELLSKLLGVMQSPVSGFARALAALAEKKQAEAAKRTCISVIDRWLYPNSI